MNIRELNGRPLRLLIGGSPCVPSGTKIKVQDGYKNIEDIKVGDFVLTHKNRYKKVIDTMSKVSDHLYHIKFNGSETLDITGNHPLYIMRDDSIEWIEAQKLKVGDYVCVNINQNKICDKYSYNDLWLFGRYLADGYREKKRTRVSISVSKIKTIEFEEHLLQSGYHYHIIHPDRPAPEYVITDISFYNMIKRFADGAHYKFVPDFILDLDVKSLKCFIDGYWSGDGHCRKDRKETWMWSTVNFELVLSMALAVSKVYNKYPTVTKKVEKNKIKTWRDGKTSTSNDSYNSQIILHTSTTRQIVIGDKLFIPVKNIIKEDIDIQVYNISVEDDESYTANNIIVHNCTNWSIAQRKHREDKAEGVGWELFKNYLIAKEKFKPDLFLYENNKSAAQEIKEQISKELEQPLQVINSALVSGQKRLRFYVKNWECPQPEDRGITLQSILELHNSIVEREKAYCLCTDHTGTTRDYFKKKQSQIVFEPIDVIETNGAYVCTCYDSIFTTGANKPLEGKLFDPIPDCLVGLVCDKGKIYRVKNGIMSNKFGDWKVGIPDGYYLNRKLTTNEYGRLQNLPDGYVDSVSKQQGYKAIGNGWTTDVIIHQLEYGLKDIPKDYPIEVLSMYDGIATGRYCLDKMGFTNITYKAYEIDSHAMKVATTNYPDIIECGDAFQLREDGWKY